MVRIDIGSNQNSTRREERILKSIFLGMLLIFSIFWTCERVMGETYSGEYRLKAETIYNLLKFIEWSNRQKGDFIFCVAGKNPFDSKWDVFGKKQVRGRKVIFNQAPGLDRASCDILFISSSEEKKIPEIRKELGTLGVLTIGDTPGFGEKGLMINLRKESEKIAFEINPEAAVMAGLRISSKLLNLAATVHTTP